MKLLYLLTACGFAFACGSSSTITEFEPYEYTIPEATDDGWLTASLADVGMIESRLVDLVDLIHQGTYTDVHGIVIVKNGRLVFEEYFSGIDFQAAVDDTIVGIARVYDRDVPHNLASVTKSITSTILGVAIDKGFITGVDTAVYDFFPEHDHLRTPEKNGITLEHMLTMSSGLDWDETTCTYGQRCNDINALFFEDDPLAYVLAKEVVDVPGSRWIYNGGGTNVLGQVVRKASGLTLEQFANDHLFAPLGVSPPTWILLAGQMTYASGDLRLRPRDMAKIGYLFVNDGIWNGERILSSQWIADATEYRLESGDPGWGYGYQWWLFDYPANGRTYQSFGARGWGGQLITVFPEADLVVVLTGGAYLTPSPADAIIHQFVLQALLE